MLIPDFPQVGPQGIVFEYQTNDWPEMLDEKKLKEWLHSVAEEEGHKLALVQFIFCTDEFLLDLNQSFLQHDTLTDVITFPLGYNPISTEIYISTQRVKENANKEKVNYLEELSRVMVHGLLHMMNYNDKTPKEKGKMTERENHHLSKFFNED